MPRAVSFKDPAFWEAAWEEVRSKSILRHSQVLHPKKWETFYDRVAPLWEDLWGHDQAMGDRVSEALVAQGLVGGRRTLLDLGCGPGTLSLALARRGLRVTALDQSAGMIACLQNRVREEGLKNLRVERADWVDFHPPRRFDLVLAAFFPPALDPAGLRRLEALSLNHCLVLVNGGRETFPLRREIWEAVMGEPCPDPPPHLSCLVNWLLSSGRKPNLAHLDWRTKLSLTSGRAFDFYRHYFSLFQRKGPGPERIIRRVLKSYEANGSVVVDGEVHLALVWWTRSQRKRPVP